MNRKELIEYISKIAEVGEESATEALNVMLSSEIENLQNRMKTNNKHTKYKIILFDLDDCLVNTKTAIKSVFIDIANEMGISIDEDKYNNFLEFDNEFWKNYLKIEVPSHITIENKAEYYRALRFKKFFGNITFDEAEEFNRKYTTIFKYYKGLKNAKELIKTLYEQGYLLYIATNGPETLAAKKLKLAEIDQYIKGLYGYETTLSSKPHEEFFENVFHLIGNPPKESVLLVGDSLATDILGGNKFGIDTCWFNEKNKELEEGYYPKYIISDLLELLNYLN